MRRLSLVFASGCVAQNTTGGGSNPMEEVRKQLIGMIETLEHEREKNTELDKKVTCHCNNSIEKSQAIVVEKQTCIESETSARDNHDGKASEADDAATKLEEEVKQKTEDLEKTRKKKAVRHAADMVSKSDLTQLEAALSEALEKLQAGQSKAADATAPKSFLQSQSKAELAKIAKGLSLGKDLLDIQEILKPSERRMLNSFIQQKQPDIANEGSNLAGILGMIETMHEDAANKLAELEKKYEEAMKSFVEAIKLLEEQIAKAKEGAANKRQRQQEATGKKGKASTALADCTKALADENKFLQDRIQECEDHKKQFSELMEQNATEHSAVSQAVEFVNKHRGDFRNMSFLSKSSSFLQVGEQETTTNSEEKKNSEVAEIESAIKSFEESASRLHSGRFGKLARRASLSLALAKESKSASKSQRSSRMKSLVAIAQKVTWRETVCVKIVEYIEEIKQIGEEDTAAHDSCKSDINSMTLEKGELENLQQTLEDKRAAREKEIEVLEHEIENLEEEIVGKKDDMSKATLQRQEENEAFTTMTTDNQLAVKIIEKMEVVLGNAFTATQTGTGATGKAGTFLLQQQEREQQDVDGVDTQNRRELATFDKQQGTSQEGNTVLALLQQIKNDVVKKNQNAEAVENQQQAEYMALITDLATAIKDAEVTIADKQEAKAYSEEMMAERENDITNTNADHVSTAEALEARQKACKWLMDNLETRRNGQKLEIQALDSAKALIKCHEK